MAMTSQERYELMLEQDRLGVNTGKDQRLLAAINAGEISIEEALPPITSSGNSMMTFGGPAAGSTTGATSSGSQDRFGQLLGATQTATQGTPTAPAPDPNQQMTFGGPAATPPAEPSPAEPTQEQQMNQAFIEFLRQLGLENLVQLFTSGDFSLTGNGGVPTSSQSQGMLTPYVPTPYTPQTVDFSSQLLPMNEVGYDPYRGMYNVPKAMQPGTVANATGLFRYIYGPFGQYPQPMNPYVPQVTPPTIAPNV